jgi:hypothetical protein
MLVACQLSAKLSAWSTENKVWWWWWSQGWNDFPPRLSRVGTGIWKVIYVKNKLGYSRSFTCFFLVRAGWLCRPFLTPLHECYNLSFYPVLWWFKPWINVNLFSLAKRNLTCIILTVQICILEIFCCKFWAFMGLLKSVSRLVSIVSCLVFSSVVYSDSWQDGFCCLNRGLFFHPSLRLFYALVTS